MSDRVDVIWDRSDCQKMSVYRRYYVSCCPSSCFESSSIKAALS